MICNTSLKGCRLMSYGKSNSDKRQLFYASFGG
jgi:hypothetical protein